MSVAIPIPLLQHLPDVNVTPAVGVDENMLVYDHDTARFVLRAPFAGLLATGATVGATAQAQAFTFGVVSPFIAPAADSTTAWQVRKADKTTAVVTVDTTNGRVGIGTASPQAELDVNGTMLVNNYPKDTFLHGYGGNSNTYPFLASLNNVSQATATHGWGFFNRASDGNLQIASMDGSTVWVPALTIIRGTASVGIGAVSPATALHVVGAATITGGIRPAADSTTALQLQNVAGASVLNVDTTNARVGIGTTSPGYPLQSVSAGAGASEIVASNTAGAERIHFLSRSSAGVSYIQSQNSQLLVGTYDNFAVQLLTNNVSRIMIDTSGNVGINDVAPAEALDVTGNINTTGVVKVDDVQVLSNRVIDARCADVANSGDATTDGLIDALRDAMVAHGLIAAAA